MIRVIIDTNVLISAILKEQSNPAIVVSLIYSDYCKLCLSKEIFNEYAGVLARKKFEALDQDKIRKLFDVLKENALWCTPRESVKIAKDPGDNIFLECALESKADYLITGNIRHYPARRFGNTSILPLQSSLLWSQKGRYKKATG